MVKGSAFPLLPGKWRISTGIFKNTKAIRCFEDASIQITALDGTTANYDLVAGTDTSIGFIHQSLSVLTGVVSIADNSTA